MASRSTAIADAPAPSPLRVSVRLASLVLLFIACAPLHLCAKWTSGRSRWPRRFLAGAARLCGARVSVVGDPIAPHTLLLVNHTSWLDVLILGGAVDCRFVSKDSLGHGFVHWLADQNGTVYVKRAHRKGAKDQALAISKALEGTKPVALFPEGTTGPGTRLLRFRSTLLEAANFAAKDVAIRPVAIDYGADRAEVGWYEESGKANVLRILGRVGTLRVRVHVLPALSAGDRKQLAAAAAADIAEALGFKSEAQSPIGGVQ